MRIICPCCGHPLEIIVNAADVCENERRTRVPLPEKSPGDSQTNMNVCDEIDDIVFAGSVFVITGKFTYAERDEISIVIEKLGGSVSSGVSQKVNYLLVGAGSSAGWSGGNYGNKIVRALELKSQGFPLKIVSETNFLTILQQHTTLRNQ